MTSAPRGMPSMELSENTKEQIAIEQEEAKPKPSEEMFQRPTMEIKPIKKPKKKLTEKQLEALRKGREKSIATRKANAEAKKKAKQQVEVNPTAPQVEQKMAQPPPVQYQPPQIDYDKIINGVASRYDNMMKQRMEREHRVAEDINVFEQKIREEERNKVLDEIDKLQKQEEMEKAQQTAYQTISKARPPASQNPYLYAMNMGARNRFKRY
jgi:preprotein translocase subunit SecD